MDHVRALTAKDTVGDTAVQGVRVLPTIVGNVDWRINVVVQSRCVPSTAHTHMRAQSFARMFGAVRAIDIHDRRCVYGDNAHDTRHVCASAFSAHTVRTPIARTECCNANVIYSVSEYQYLSTYALHTNIHQNTTMCMTRPKNILKILLLLFLSWCSGRLDQYFVDGDKRRLTECIEYGVGYVGRFEYPMVTGCVRGIVLRARLQKCVLHTARASYLHIATVRRQLGVHIARLHARHADTVLDHLLSQRR
jgi:hypothetical protein